MKDTNVLPFTYRIYSKKEIQSLEKKMNLLGYYSKNRVNNFLIYRIISSLIIFICSYFLFDKSLFISIIATIIYYFGIVYLCLDKKIKKRSISLDNDSLLFFEVLSLALQSGKDIITSLEITSNAIDSELSNEIKKTLKEIKYGKSLTMALNDLRKKIPSANINNVILNMNECYLSGGNLVETLNEQVIYIRSVKKSYIKEKINKLPIQISVVSVIFIVPMILLLLLAPAIMRYFS